MQSCRVPVLACSTIQSRHMALCVNPLPPYLSHKNNIYTYCCWSDEIKVSNEQFCVVAACSDRIYKIIDNDRGELFRNRLRMICYGSFYAL